MDASLDKTRQDKTWQDKTWYTTICHVDVITHINACQSPTWLSYPILSYPITAKPMMHLSAESMILQYWSTVHGCIPGQDMIYHHLSYSRYNSYQCLSVPDMTLLYYRSHAKPMMHLSAERMISIRLNVDGCIPGQDMIYHHLSCSCYHTYQCSSVPDMTLLSYTIAAMPTQWCICQLRAWSQSD